MVSGFTRKRLNAKARRHKEFANGFLFNAIAKFANVFYMNPIRLELEKKFLELPSLNHIGLALMQFAFALQRTPNITKDAFGVYCMGFVSFGFPKGNSAIKMFVRNINVELLKKEFGFNWLPLVVEDGFENGTAVCEILNAGHLGQAAKYIWNAHNGELSKRIITPALSGN